MDDAVLQELYVWVDKIPLSRVKKNISRDFSDGVLMAEIMKHFFPKIVDVNNYHTCHSIETKRKNWRLLNWKVFKKLNFELSAEVIENLCLAKTGTIEKVLLLIRTKIDEILSDDNEKVYDNRPEADHCMINNFAKKKLDSPNHLKKITSISSDRSSSKSPKKINKNINKDVNLHSTPQKPEYVPRRIYEKKVQECLALEDAVDIFQTKIKKLDNLLSLKDKRIDELQKKISMLSIHCE